MNTIFNELKRSYQRLPPGVRDTLRPVKEGFLDIRYKAVFNAKIRPMIESIRAGAENHPGDKILVDCGFNQGKPLERFARALPEFKIYGFEVNEEYFRDRATQLKNRFPNIVQLRFSAVSNHNGTAFFKIAGAREGAHIAEGTSIIPDFSPGAPQMEPREVHCVNFPEWIRETYIQHVDPERGPPRLAGKMDIEGAEYDILEDMIEDGSARFLSDLMIEFHAHCMGDRRPEYERREAKIREGLQDHGVMVYDWPL